jgi:hypothetical protein
MGRGRSLCCVFAAILCSLCAVSTAQAAKPPTVIGALKRLAAAGTLTPADYAARRAAYENANATVKRLTGTRRAELAGVVGDLNGMAARGEIVPTRIPALWLTLARNVQWWTSSPLLGYNQRVGFDGSELVWQHYAGHGIQIQWLATFGKLNALWTGGKRYDTRLGALLDEILPLATERAGGLAWEYMFPFDGQQAPWVSSLSQGTGLQSMARAATRLGRQATVLPIAARGLAIFQKAPPEGVRVAADGGAHYLQYSGLPKLRILNGFIQSLVGLYDYATLTGDTTARSLFESGDVAARKEVPTFDTGAWSLYSRGTAKAESDLGYHTLLRDFLSALCTRTEAQVYCATAQRFTADLTTAPALKVLPATLRLGHTGTLRFTLSKIASVSVSVTRDGKLVSTHGLGTVGRGTRGLAWKPPRHSGAYTVTVKATDLAGNPASASGTVEVKRRPK